MIAPVTMTPAWLRGPASQAANSVTTMIAADMIQGDVRPRRRIGGRYCMPVGPQPPGFLPFEKSRWNAEAVGSDWPWYFAPSSGEPYGRSTAEDILKNEIWPIFMPW